MSIPRNQCLRCLGIKEKEAHQVNLTQLKVHGSAGVVGRPRPQEEQAWQLIGKLWLFLHYVAAETE